jgi:hypothetical protein
MVDSSKFDPVHETPDRTGVLRRIAMVKKSKRKDACQAECVARTSTVVTSTGTANQPAATALRP